jgi:hypothetical protein
MAHDMDEKHLPYKWQEKLVSNQEIGGVFLVFLTSNTLVKIVICVKISGLFIQ